jgi:DNA-binding response OmpR family regulator
MNLLQYASIKRNGKDTTMIMNRNSRRKKTKRVLLIDDDNTIFSTVKIWLEKAGYDFFRAEDGIAGLRIAARKKPDLILLDVIMPGLDGIETLRRLKEDGRTCAIPVIMLTGVDDSRTMKVAMHEYAEQYITKPVERRVLLAKMSQLLSLLAAAIQRPDMAEIEK